MPTRLIREGMLDSERVCQLPLEARWLYLTICLTADDAGLFDAAPFALMRKAELHRELGPQLLAALADADLIRLYEVGGKRYGFVPRYGQRVQMRRLRHPLPPSSIAQDDADALRKFNDLAKKSRGISVNHGEFPPEAEAEAEKEIEATSVASRHPAADGRHHMPACPYEKILEAFHASMTTLPQVVVFNTARKAPVQARWREVCTAERFDQQAGIAWFESLFRMLGKSAFLTGRSGKFKASFDWIMAPKNFAKCVEGNYQNETV